MFRKDIVFLGVVIIVLSYVIGDAYALSPNVNRYVASKAFPEQMLICPEKLLDGTLAPSKSENWEANPEFKPQNRRCYNNDGNCPPKEAARNYIQKALQENDACKKSFNLGVYSTLWGFSQTPSNWLQIEPTCQTQFLQEIEQNVTELKEDWLIIKECRIIDEEGSIALNFSAQDLNGLIGTIKSQWGTAQLDQNIIVPAFIPDLEKRNLFELVQQIIDENKLVTTAEQLNTKTLRELWDYSCLMTSTRKEDLYNKWQELDFTGKSCLDTFLAQGTSNAFTLAANCFQLGGGTTTIYNQQSLSFAQFELIQYSRLGFGETKCRKVTIPTYLGFGQQTQQLQPQQELGIPQPGIFEYEICEYIPKNISPACVQEFRQLDKFQDDKYNAGLADGMLRIMIIFLIGGVLIYVFWTAG